VDPQPSDYPVNLGAMLFTLVDPTPGYEVAYNRWYERDHFYGGCMIGPWILAGGRWVSPRSHKDLRFPTDTAADVAVASPVDAGSYLATYWVERDHWPEHFAWGTEQVKFLYSNGRGFEERQHAHTVLYTLQRTHYRDEDPTPIELALDHRYAGLVSLHIDRADGVKHPEFDEWVAATGRDHILGPDSEFAMASSWRPVIPPETQGAAPMALGTGPGSRARSAQLLFCETDPAEVWDQVHAYADAIEDSGLATVVLAAPFIPTIIGTDTYTNQLW